MREETRWGWPAEGRQCQRRQPCYGLICSARRDGSHCYTNDADLILRIANEPDRNYPRWWQRMEMHARHVHISVQLLASLLHFIIASVSAITVSAVQIQMMDRLNEEWSLHTMYICTFCAWLKPAKVCGSVLVWNTCTTCIFLRHLHRSKYEQPIRRMDYWWSLKERALKIYTSFLHALCISDISICMCLNYIV